MQELRDTRARAGGATLAMGGATALQAELAVRRPFHGEGLAQWFAHRAVPGVEHVDGTLWTRAVHLPHGPGVVEVDLGADGPLPLTLRLADLRDYAAAVSLVRRLLDLDADPVGIDQHVRRSVPGLAALVEQRPGVRIPGTASLKEALLWAIVGQQITTAQAREQITRATDLVGEALPSGLRGEHVYRLPVRPAEAARTAADWYRGPAARRRALTAALDSGIELGPAPEVLRTRLLALPGVGPWTADYALLRAAGVTDAAPARDAALLAAARGLGIIGSDNDAAGNGARGNDGAAQQRADHTALQRALEPASPWRSYAALHLWLHNATSGPQQKGSSLRPSGRAASTGSTPTLKGTP